MEYEGEEIDGPGSAPEFGAIFMSNNATKRECFRRNILALPSSKANFVKHVKEGMVLFLFEFEKRQLFGVYQATSDGGMNISPSPFIFSGRHFPAQVCFSPIWECTPLFENEFRDAIRENYYTSKKFHFGLSQKQVHRLLLLFSSRKLLSRQLSRSADNDRRWADQDRFSIRERLETENCEDDLPPGGTSEFSPNSLHRAIEANDNMLFIDDRVENGKGINFMRDNFLTGQVGNSLRKRKRVYEDDADTELYDTHTPLLSYRTDNHEVSLSKERILGIRGRFPVTENSENDCNIYTSCSPGVGTNHSKASLDFNRRADYERPNFESGNRHAIDNDRFLGDDTMTTAQNLHGTYRHAKFDELEDLLERPERSIDGSELLRSSLGHNYNMDDDVKAVVPSKNYDNFQHVVKVTSGGSKLLMDKSMGTEHNLGDGLGFDLLSEKFRNSFDSNQRMVDERRFPLGSKMMKANCMGGVHGATTLYEPSGYDTRIQRQVASDYPFSENSGLNNRQDGGSFLRSVSKAAFPNSSECFSKLSLDSQFFQRNGLQNRKTSNSMYQDSVVTRTVPSAPECTTIQRHSSSTGIDRGASLGLGITHYNCGGDLLDLSNRKSCGGEGCDRTVPAAMRENNNFHPASHDFIHPFTKVSQHLELRSSPPAVDVNFLFAPSTHGSVPFTDSGDLSLWRESPLASDNQTLPQGTQKHNQWQEIDQRNAGNDVLSSNSDLTGLGYHLEKHLTNEELEYFKRYRSHISNDDGQHLNPGRVYSDSQTQRESVFSRSRLGPRLHVQVENAKDDTFYLDASVDEVMDLLNSCQNIRKNHRKFKHVVRQRGRDELVRNEEQASRQHGRDEMVRNEEQAFRQHGRDEMVRTEKQASPEHAKRFLVTRVEDETSRVIVGVHEMPKETREVDFKRRRDLKNGSDENGTKNNVLREEDNMLREISESDGPVNKQQKRRKLVRPTFGSDASVDAVDNEKLHPQSYSSQNK